nr:8-oxo-dGTP diphosphatase MutT [Pseudoalteromonas sp. MMG013]
MIWRDVVSKKVIEVAVGVIKTGSKIFISKRHESQHQGGLWEFPGGKVEIGETAFTALKRELKEEVNIDVLGSRELQIIEHDYGDKCVRLIVHIVDKFAGEAKGLEAQLCQWVEITSLNNYAFPAANQAIIDKLHTEMS